MCMKIQNKESITLTAVWCNERKDQYTQWCVFVSKVIKSKIRLNLKPKYKQDV